MWLVEDFHVQEQTEVSQCPAILNDPKVLELVSLHLSTLLEIRLTQPSNISPFFWLICPRLCGKRRQPLIHSMPQTLRGSVCVPRPTTLPASNLIWKHFSSLSSSSPASSSSSSHSTSSSFLLFTTSTHAQLLSTFVLSERVCCLCAFMCHFITFPHISDRFLFGGVGFACCTASAPRELPRADEVLPYYRFLAEANESNLIIILLKEARQSRFALAQQKPKYMRFRHKYIRGVGVPLKGIFGRKSLMALGSVINM